MSKRTFYPTTLGGGPPRIVTLRGSARGSYLEALPQQGQICSNMCKICPQLIQKVSNPPKFLPPPPKSRPKPSKSNPKSIQKASRSSSWTNALKRYDFERQKTSQNASKSGQKMPQSVPNLSQMEPKTLPNPLFRPFCAPFFPT